MIDLRAGLGAPPIVFPGVQMQRQPEAPSGLPGSAPMMPASQAAARALGCVGCAPQAMPSGVNLGVGDLRAWHERIPLWAKIAAGVIVFGGVSYGVYRLVR